MFNYLPFHVVFFFSPAIHPVPRISSFSLFSLRPPPAPPPFPQFGCEDVLLLPQPRDRPLPAAHLGAEMAA
jgi:hypothetical protein